MVLYCCAFNCKEKYVKGGPYTFHSILDYKPKGPGFYPHVRHIGDRGQRTRNI
ncbi:unnamed protein product [Larinioides sclopetarius]|uniref:Uncharacterized protein n=1 Tax=Larinioides sclopetarius TaxID=280406 RepID=A0AAV2C0L8_9ARAC